MVCRCGRKCTENSLVLYGKLVVSSVVSQDCSITSVPIEKLAKNVCQRDDTNGLLVLVDNEDAVNIMVGTLGDGVAECIIRPYRHWLRLVELTHLIRTK